MNQSRPRSRQARWRRARRLAAGGALAAALATGMSVSVAPATAAAAVPYAPQCSSISEQYPTTDPGYGIPIENQIVNGVLTDGSSQITNIDASVCGVLRFPSLSADIPAANIRYGQAKATLGGALGIGTVKITASAPSTAVTSGKPAPDGGLVFTLTAATSNVITLTGGFQCVNGLSATLNTNPSDGGTALTGPLATGASGTAYAPKGKVSLGALSPVTPLSAAACAAANLALGAPSNTNSTFKAPIDFYSTLTSFG